MPVGTDNVPVTASEMVVDQWLSRIEHARKCDDREAFDAVAEACYSFYKKSAKFMWEDSFRKKFLGDIDRPRFETTINAAAQYVEIFGPYLFWDYPHRQARAYDPLVIDHEIFGGDDEQMAAWIQAIDYRQQYRHRMARQSSALMSRYLNYSQREQPQGLQQHSMMAIIDALVKGRGVLVPRAYSMPGSERTLTGLFYEPVQNLLIDPDCCDPLLDTATWIAIRHTTPAYELEDRFNLERGTLAEAGNLESYESVAMNNRPIDKIHRTRGRTNDIVVWYEIWSMCGVAGRRRDNSDIELVKEFDRVVGDYAYLCIAPGVPWALNAPPSAFHDDVTDDEVADMLGWPFPCHADGRWPVSLLDFRPDPESAWPIAPLSSGLGHLICLNVLMAAYVEQAYENRKQIIGAIKSYAKEVRAALKKRENPAVIELSEDLEKEVNKVVQYLNRPNANTDILTAIEMQMREFQKATGLVDFMYAAEQTQDRTARSTAAKEEKTAIRPEKMAKDVAAWQSKGATLEAMLATLEVQGDDVEPHIPAELWDMLIVARDPEMVWREMTCVVEATDVRRPNRERDLSNLQTMSQQATAAFMQYAQITGDSEPLNNFYEALFTSMEQTFHGLRMGPWVPQQDEAAQQQAAMQQQIEQQKLEAELAKADAEIEVKRTDAEAKAMQAGLKGQEMRQKLLFDAIGHAQDLKQDSAEHALDLEMTSEKGEQDLILARAKTAEQIRAMRAMARARASSSRNGSA